MTGKWTLTVRVAALAIAGLIGLAACTWTQRGAGIGAGAGSLIGGIIGHQSGHTAEGALIGAAAGGLAGALVGNGVDQVQARRRERENRATQEELRQRIDQLEEENRQLHENRSAQRYSTPPPAQPPRELTREELLQRLDQLEEENRRLRGSRPASPRNVSPPSTVEP